LPLKQCDSKTTRISWRLYLIAAGFAAALFLLHSLNLFNFHELNAVDLRFKLRGEKKADPRIVIVEIDDASLRTVGQWPWPRGTDGALLATISQYHPRFVLLDLLFTEPSPDPSEDDKLTFAVKNAGNVILPFYFYSLKPFGAFFPIPALQQAAKSVGFVNMDTERDGIVRKFQPYLKTETGEFYPSVSLALLLQMTDTARHSAVPPSLPLDHKGRMWINYPGTISSFKRITGWEVIDAVGKKDDELRHLFSNSFVLIGHTATATSDLKPAPFSPLEPGVAIHASALHTLLSGKFLVSAPPLADFLILLFLLLSVTAISQAGSPKKILLMTTALWLGYAVLNFFFFIYSGMIFLLSLPLTGMILIYVLMLFLKYVDIRFQGELLHRELQTAARIQESFLPKGNPAIKTIDAAFECRFAKQVGGDLYDWTELGDKRLAVCVGDVSGKGCPAALYMARAINEMRREYRDGRLPGELNTILNANLLKGESSGMFLTLFYAIIDTERKKISFSNAGHEPPLYYSAASKKAQTIELAQGTPLGLFEESAYATAEIPYQAGDMFWVISDGIKELRNPKKEQFGMERLGTLLEKEAPNGLSAAKMIATVFQALDGYRKGMPPHDDRTILCVRFE